MYALVQNGKCGLIGELHANMSQSARLDSLEKFRNHEFAYLVATDVAGRGLDIVGVEVVINYDAPPSIDTYLHRIGRTARAGAEGKAVTFVTDANRALLREVLNATRQKLTHRIIPSEAIDYFSRQLQLHQRHLKLIENEETAEEKLSRAEMEVDRAKNVIEHEKEILSRPPRTWFQTKEQRKETQKLARLEDEGRLAGEMSVEALSDDRRTKKKPKTKKGEQVLQQHPNKTEAKAARGMARNSKRLHRLFEEQGSSARSANQKVLAAVTSAKRKKGEQDPEEYEGFLKDPSHLQRKSKATRKAAAVTSSREEAAAKSRVYAGGAKSGRVDQKKISKKQKNLMKRGGKGKHAFKGKRKFKRR